MAPANDPTKHRRDDLLEAIRQRELEPDEPAGVAGAAQQGGIASNESGSGVAVEQPTGELTDEQWIFDLAADHEARGNGLFGPVTFNATGLVEFTRAAIAAHLASQSQAAKPADEELPISRSVYGSLEECEREQARRNAAHLAGKSQATKVQAEPIGHVVTWNKGGSGQVNSIEPIGKSGYSLAASLPEGTLIFLAPTTSTVSAPTDYRAMLYKLVSTYFTNNVGENVYSLMEAARAHFTLGGESAGTQAAPQEVRNQVLRELLNVGGQMANVMYNLAQAEGRPLERRSCETMDALRKQWDALKRTSTDQADTDTGSAE